uniref:Immunoglobulin V-set domain-containing protein n=1 Tax=Periophthalmus magnuspinnatus TaxID=409849 RepID=A0A3B3ZQY3_9GOBI
MYIFIYLYLSICLYKMICFIPGIHSVKTVGHIMMEAGGTVHIPCQYETHYIDNVKYLCRGATWASCKYQICSNHPDSPKYSINDDKTQRIVTFTVKSLEVMDSDTYWCNIEKTGTDDGKNFQLSITTKATIATTTTMSTVETESTPVFSTHQPGNKRSVSAKITQLFFYVSFLFTIYIVDSD